MILGQFFLRACLFHCSCSTWCLEPLVRVSWLPCKRPQSRVSHQNFALIRNDGFKGRMRRIVSRPDRHFFCVTAANTFPLINTLRCDTSEAVKQRESVTLQQRGRGSQLIGRAVRLYDAGSPCVPIPNRLLSFQTKASPSPSRASFYFFFACMPEDI